MFHSARLKLTFWYLLIIMFVSIAFSAAIYRGLVGEVERFDQAQRFRMERRFRERGFLPPEGSIPLPVVDQELINEVKQRIFILLGVINGGIFVLSGGLAYFLAGRTLRPIKEMVEEQNRFITDSSHEFKTPFTSLKTAFEVHLRNKKRTQKESDELVFESISEVNKLQTLSESLLQLAQYQKPNGSMKFEKLKLQDVLNSAIRKIAPLAKKKKIFIKNTSADILVEGSKESLIDLFVILSDNAVKYSLNGKKIIIQAKKTRNWVQISVKDGGIGIEEKDLPYIFDRFFRSDMSRSKEKVSGYGLGLYIAKKIVDAHRGSVSVESEINKGTTFVVSLPL